MTTNRKLGVETMEDYGFRGTSLASKTDRSVAREREECFGGGKPERDYLGLVSFGIFVLIVGVVFAINPNTVADFGLWIGQLTSKRVLIRPPESLIVSATLFFGLIGVSNFFTAAVRLIVDRVRRRMLSDALTGVALVLFAYLIHLYGQYALTWQMVIGIEAVACGLLVILYSVARYVFFKSLT